MQRRITTGILGLMAAAMCTACGNDAVEKRADETAAPAETVSDETSLAEKEIAEEKVSEQPTVQESKKEDAAIETEPVEEKENEIHKYMLGDGELEKIVQQYDEVLSNYDVECYFGYNKPDEGWSKTWDEWDGRQEGKNMEELSQGNERLIIEGFEAVPTEIISVFDEEGNEVEVQADSYEYECRYNDAIRSFCKTGEWVEPERCQKSYYEGMNYCIDRRLEGRMDTPYGEGTLYSAVYEHISYEEYNEQEAYWTQIDDSSRYWYRREGMIIEVDDYFVQIELSVSEDWYLWEGESGEGLLGIEYSGRLEEILPQMFEVK